jgi:hypothetical protein
MVAGALVVEGWAMDCEECGSGLLVSGWMR